VEDQVGDRVREAVDVTVGKFGGNIFYARNGIDVGAFAAEEFEKSLLGHFDSC
jgi:hypothetical protein